MAGYFTALVADKRAHPADDLLSALIDARDAGDGLSERELLGMLFLLLVAGHETTVNLIGSGMLALLLNPGELARLRADPSLLPAARWRNSSATPARSTTPPSGSPPSRSRSAARSSPAREPVLVAISSANRDPDRYAAPDRLDLGRDSGREPGLRPRHPLLPGRAAGPDGGRDRVRRPARAVPGSMTLAVPPESLRWRPSTLIHGLESLPVRLIP